MTGFDIHVWCFKISTNTICSPGSNNAPETLSVSIFRFSLSEITVSETA